MRTIMQIAATVVILASASSADAASRHAKHAPFTLNGTTWTFLDDGTKVQESIDGDGNYIINAVSGKHLDHGTVVRRDGKFCHTSAMNHDGEQCWTVPAAKIGQSVVAVSEKGKKLKVTRTAYKALEMPK